ncbi:MAG: hypothetical protein KGJ87_08835 [Planctomycetota bacterium]|nr:hypothetical protein [Planctomycetota bacterium]MDE2217246.1 hypothetical protein [Planctomycetota bacterium]
MFLIILGLPTWIKILYDLYSIQLEQKPINHRSELTFTVGFGLFVAIMMCMIHPMYQESVFLNVIRNVAMEWGIFILFFDMSMGMALHNDPLYVNTTDSASTWDKNIAAIGPSVVLFLRLFAVIVTSMIYFNYQPY